MDNLHDRALEVARQILVSDPEFPELIEIARLLLEGNLGKDSSDCEESTSQQDTDPFRG